ncbi:adhesin AidA-related [Fibrisoma limi BUZ 3]|uniref:Adhesin AidA-related n=1 Tax=Fibrisoma limi BUZ 3 TaxID=1185876 RepID=I2GD47_9BACT|nr:adhesin AidA-related [Fibrisoma limi]CCH51821.1 adhesin AidA-related [Fibrisoma limi BUZ 3]
MPDLSKLNVSFPRRILSRIGLLLLLISGMTFSTVTPALAQLVEICNNNIDDDGDNLIDCQDPDCPECAQTIECGTSNTCYMPPIYGNPTTANVNYFGSQDLVLSTNAPFTTVRIRTPDGSYDQTVVVTSTGSTIVSLPTSLTGGQTVVMSNTVNTVQRNKGLIITSDEPIQATYRQTASLNQDIVPLKCRAALGYAFYTGSQTRLTTTNNNLDERHFVGVMATQNNTVVTFRLPPSAAGAPTSVTSLQGITTFPHTVTLNAGDTYLVSTRIIGTANSENRSVAGVLVTSNQPIVVNSGSQHNGQPYSGNKDAGIDQLVPARTTGQNYVAVHGQNTTANSDYIFVVGIERATTVTISGPTSAGGTVTAPLATTVINNGEVFTYNLPNYPNRAFTITTSRRAYTYQVSSYAANEFGMGILPTINPCNGSRRIDFYRTSSSSNDQAIVTIPQAGLSSLRFRGQPYTTYGTVVDNVTVGGVPQAIVSFPNGSIAAAGTVNTVTSNERFQVGVISNTGGTSTGNFGFYSNYDARVDVLNPDNNLPDDFYTAAEVTPGQAVTRCLRLASCGTRNRITSIVGGSLTQSVSFSQDSCITYTMRANAPSCSRDTIRVAVENELGRQGTVCLEFVNRNNDLTVTILPANPVVCLPGGTTSLTAVATSSSGNYTYQWITPDKQILTTRVISTTAVGRYNLTVTNAQGCRDTTSIVVQAETPTLSFASGPTTACTGSTATYTLAGSSGTYSWSVTNGTITAGGTPTSNSVTVRWTGTTPGTVRATVTTPSGCTATVAQSVTVFATPTLTVTTQNPRCNGSSDGLVNLTVTGGTSPYTYRWSNGATVEDLAAVPAGTYSVTVTDRNTCLATPTPLSVTLTQPTALTLTTAVTNLSCSGATTGTINLTATGGTPGYTYRWSNGATTPNLAGVTAGTYSVTVTDANSCTATTSATIAQPPALRVTLDERDALCNGTSTGSVSLTVTGGTTPYSYRWNTGATTQNLPAVSAGTYSVTVADANSCTVTGSIVVSQPPALTLTAQATPVRCFGSATGAVSLAVAGGTPGYTYRWSNGATTQNLNAIVAGAYSVTVTDANSCTATTSVTVTQPIALSLSTTQQNPTCFGNANGSINLTVTGGTQPYQYRWSDGVLTEDRSALVAGVYSVTATDNNNCTAVTSVTLTQPAALTVAASVINVACAGGTTGTISLTVSGGTGPYTYRWADGPTTANRTNLAAGTYQVTVTDAQGCLSSRSFIVDEPQPLQLSRTFTNVRCFGGTDGSIDLSVVGGTQPYAYRWNTGATTQDLTGLVAGTYSVTVTDANSCSAAITTTITQPTALSLNTQVTGVACNGGANGAINLSVTGGTLPYQFRWTTGATTEDVSGLTAGVYSVTVTDANLCTATTSVTVTQPTALNLLTDATNPSCFGSADGAISLTVLGGTVPDTYQWSNGAITEGLIGLTAGVYSVTVTDVNNCTIATSVSLTQPAALSLTTSSTNVACNGARTGAINLTVSGGTTPYRYAWSNTSGIPGATTEDLASLPAGTYSVTVTDANGCTATTSVTITEPPALAIQLTEQDAACNGATNGAVNLTVTGGTPAYTYRWSNGTTTEDLTGLVAGTYSVTVTDANSCTISGSVVVAQPTALSLTTQATPVRCFGGSDGSVQLAVAGGTLPYAFRWSTGATTEDITGVSAGVYSVTVTDANQCTGVMSATVGQPTALNIAAVTRDVGCFDQPTGSISVTVTGGVAPYEYSWNDNVSTRNRQALVAGVYSVTVTDNNQCTAFRSFTLTQPDSLNLSEVIKPVSCKGGSDGAIDLTVTGGTAPYQYAWTNTAGQPVAATQDLANIPAGNYTVTVTDAAGCVSRSTSAVTEPDSLIVEGMPSNLQCSGQSGSITPAVRGGTQPYSYQWSNGATTPSVFGLPAGSYTLVVTDANGCQASLQTVITQPPPFAISAQVTPETCNESSDGAINLIIEGATPPYQFRWSNGATTEDLTGLTAGTYSVTVTDANGCTETLMATITEPPALVLSATEVNASCFQGRTGSIDLTVTGGTAPYKYRWSDSLTTQDRTNLEAGTYVVTVTDNNGCVQSLTVVITQPPALVINTSEQDVSCNGGSNGFVRLTVTGGTGAYAYRWNNGATTSEINGLTAGIYSVTVTDANSCTATERVVVNQPTALSLSAADQDVRCFGGNDGSIRLAVSGGTQPYTYRWNTGATSENLSGLTAGVYSATVTDANGCSISLTDELTQPAALSIAAQQTNVRCFGGDDGTISLTVTGGTLPYEYEWADGAATRTRQGLSAGVYSLTVMDGNNCVTSLSITISEPPALTLQAQVQAVACAGGATGTISLTVSGGTAPYSYSWNTGATTQNLTGLTAGTYQVTITDANGCRLTRNFTVDEPTQLQLSNSFTNVRCFGGSDGTIDLTVAGGTQPYSYSWNTGATTEDLTGLAAGVYTVTATDANLCTATMSVTISQPQPLSLTAQATPVDCFGQANGTIQLAVTGGTQPYAYQWNTGATTEDLTGLIAGIYSVTVTDSNGCTAATSVTVTQPTELSLTYQSQDPDCFGASDGGIQLTVAGGTQPYTYQWNTGATTEDLANLVAGVYSVTVTDTNGCTAATSVTLTQPTALSLSASATNVVCNGAATGQINLTVNGGTTPYLYSWSNGATTEDLSGLLAGVYSVTVTDANLCTAITSVTITQPPALTLALAEQDVLCNGGATGSINLTVTGGTPAYTYRWSNGTTTEDLSGLVAGVYSVTVNDANSCTATGTLVINQPTALTVVETSQNVRCFGGNEGAIQLAVSGGTQPYTYQWSNGATSQNLTGLIAGVYSVTVADANGCTQAVSETITQPTALSLSAQTTNVRCFGGQDGTINVTVTGGTAPYQFEWADGTATEDRQGLVAGTYSLTVTDANNCVTSLSITISQPPALALQAQIQPVACAGGATGAISLTVSGGTGPYSYSWNTGATTQNLTGLTAGAYQVTITDANGCLLTRGFTVTEPTPLLVSGNETDVSCFGGSNGSVTLTVGGGTQPYTYQWNTGATTANLSGLTAGVYSVTVIDANQCTGGLSFTISQPSALSLSAQTTPALCNGTNTGTINLMPSGGTAPYTYQWSTGATTEDLDSLAAGQYVVTVTDRNNCVQSLTVTIGQPDALVLTFTTRNIRCEGDLAGLINLTVTGGTAPYLYAWTNATGQPVATTEDLNNIGAGTYQVVVTDANGCRDSTRVTITEPFRLEFEGFVTNVTCFSGNTGSIDISTRGGTPPYRFLWNDGVTTEDRTQLVAGTYSLTVTDANDCQFSQAFGVTQPAGFPVVTANSNAPICSGDTLRLTATASVSATYRWTGPANFTANVANPTLANATTANAGLYIVTITDSAGCSGADSVSVTINQRPAFNASAVSPTCVGATPQTDGRIVLGGFNPAYRYDVSVGPTYTGPATSPAGLPTIPATGVVAQNLANPASPQPYTIRVFNDNGCFRDVTVVLVPSTCECPEICVPVSLQKVSR